MAEAHPKVIARPARRPVSDDPGLSMAGAQRVPAASKLSLKQSLFDGSQSQSTPWGRSAVRLLGAPSPLGETQEAAVPAPSRSMVLAQPAVPASYPEIDRILERQASTKPLSQGEAQALQESLEKSLARVSAPENRGDACVRTLPPEALTSATTLKNRLSQTIPTMRSGDVFEATGQELAGVEKVLECSVGLTGKSTGASTIGAWILLAGAVAGLVYLLAKKK